jgi:hypothetical protein
MKTIIFGLIALLSTSAFGLSTQDLKAGDVVLLSLKCYECRVIESETNSLFSHSGVVVKSETGEIRIAQSLGRLDHFSYAEFTKNITPGTFVHVYRPHEFKNLSVQKRQFLEKNMLDVFNEKFKNAPFDSKYLWNNFNAAGVEYLYCSEFIAKFLDHFLSKKTIPFPITYKKHLDYWSIYFKGVVPEGELGNSPAGLSRDDRFEFIGKI